METGQSVADFLSDLDQLNKPRVIHVEYKRIQRKREKSKVNIRKSSNAIEYKWVRRSMILHNGDKTTKVSITDLIRFLRHTPCVVRRMEIVTSPGAIKKEPDYPTHTLFGVKVRLNYLGRCSLPEAMMVFTPGKLAHYSVRTVGTFELRKQIDASDKKAIRLVQNLFNGELLPF